ncbi:branched-chain amino acid aminotransferase [Robertkochia solimangrovi]|uniref:branched-chain amino acid aminotransferase n=1 Tax=Robertkochia solimangrovi TaxID=2213046 RepID=UPI00117D715B|nr:branched-chain amino acid aminotransferase [Robertkochia solimangrovi]TRZ43814.1 branched chain amino acid aminotransferase [Robertkochia solimangrovi]
MSKDTISELKIEKTAKSKIGEVDFENLKFGSVFTDHMFVCDYKDGAWQTPEIVAYQPLTLDPSARVFHYGQAVFEGMKAYRDEDDQIWLFRPDENFHRINKSSARLAIPEFPENYFYEGLTTLLKLDSAWIRKGEGNSLYIRPFVIATESGVMASPSSEYKFIIICSPAQSYYGGKVKVKIADHYSRAASGGFGFAKAAGNYAGQFYPTRLANEEGYQQVIWTDANTHEYLEEAGTMNVFFRIGDKLITCPTSDRILDGVTRKSVIAIAEKLGITVEVRPIKVSELLEASKNGMLKEIFGSGTAAVITEISSFGYKGQDTDLPVLEDSYASKIKKSIIGIQYNKSEDPFGWRYKV